MKAFHPVGDLVLGPAVKRKNVLAQLPFLPPEQYKPLSIRFFFEEVTDFPKFRFLQIEWPIGQRGHGNAVAANLRAAVIVSFLFLAVVVALFDSFGHFSYRGTLIHTGTLFGTIMAFNVWYRIWPSQQKIIRAVKSGEAPDAGLVKLAGLRSRHNTYMSVPLVWAMLGQHTTYFAGGNLGIPGGYYWIVWLLVIIIGWHIVFQCYKKSGKVEGY